MKFDPLSSDINVRQVRKTRAAIYVRTTTKGSKRQLKKELKCRAYCEERDWSIDENLVVSEVASPSTLNREGLQKILGAAAARDFDVLVIYEFGELSKNAAQSEVIIDKLAENSIRIAIVHDLTPEQMLERIEKLPEPIKQELKSKMANLALRASHRQN